MAVKGTRAALPPRPRRSSPLVPAPLSRHRAFPRLVRFDLEQQPAKGGVFWRRPLDARGMPVAFVELQSLMLPKQQETATLDPLELFRYGVVQKPAKVVAFFVTRSSASTESPLAPAPPRSLCDVQP